MREYELDDKVAWEARRRISIWARDNGRHYPWRSERSPWLKLVAEILLQRTRAAAVVPAFLAIKERLPTPQEMARLSPVEVRQEIGNLGLEKRYVALVRLAAAVAERGSIPLIREELLGLPGVGVYTADAWRCFSAGATVVLVDGNISRLLHRLTGMPLEPQAHRKAAVRQQAAVLAGGHGDASYNYALLDFTMSLCCRRPRCTDCPLVDLCAGPIRPSRIR